MQARRYLADTGTGMLMAITILGALYRQQATGEGEHLQLAMQDAMTQYSRLAYAYRDLNGKAAPRAGPRSFSPATPPMEFSHVNRAEKMTTYSSSPHGQVIVIGSDFAI